MADLNSSKLYKFKLFDVLVTVTVDGSYCSEKKKYTSAPFSEWLHYHAEYELFIATDESLKLDTEEGILEFRNAAVCVPPLFKHRAIRNKDYKFFFDFSPASAKSSGFGAFMKSLSSSTTRTLEVNESVRFYVSELYELFEECSASDEIVTSLLKMLFYSLYRKNYVANEKQKNWGEESYLVKIDMIIASYKEDITLGYVAEKLGLSTRQTSRVIMKYYKSSLSELVTNQRLNVARLMLLSGEHSITEIVEEVNFSSESYFYSQFKKKFGMTPLKYKRENGKKQ